MMSFFILGAPFGSYCAIYRGNRKYVIALVSMISFYAKDKGKVISH